MMAVRSVEVARMTPAAEAMQKAGAAMARCLDELEPQCPDVELEDL